MPTQITPGGLTIAQTQKISDLWIDVVADCGADPSGATDESAHQQLVAPAFVDASGRLAAPAVGGHSLCKMAQFDKSQRNG